MLFNSLHFLLFFPVVLTAYFLTPHRFRWVLLLVSSYYFYMSWEPAYALLLLLSTVVDYVAARAMGRVSRKAARRPFLLLSLLVNLGMLALFKYGNFAIETFNHFVHWVPQLQELPAMSFLLPVGISFYTFQTIGYTIDVYRGTVKPEKHFGRFAVYVSFFPQLVAGPIERAGNLLPQFTQQHAFDGKRVQRGLQVMLLGFFCKILVADRLSPLVDAVYGNIAGTTALQHVLATYAFAFQIYADFAGYSLIAIGAGQCMGFRLMENFRLPYGAESISDFWRRWHVSLSTWLKDYVYIPLGGNRKGTRRTLINVLLVFALSGLWHGAAWTFVLWGALHGLYMLVSHVTQNLREQIWKYADFLGSPRIKRAVRVFFTFHLVLIGWVFFRAASFADAWRVLQSFLLWKWQNIFTPLVGLPVGAGGLFLTVVFLCWTEYVFWVRSRDMQRPWFFKTQRWLRWGVYMGMILCILLFGQFDETPFIYFQF